MRIWLALLIENLELLLDRRRGRNGIGRLHAGHDGHIENARRRPVVDGDLAIPQKRLCPLRGIWFFSVQLNIESTTA